MKLVITIGGGKVLNLCADVECKKVRYGHKETAEKAASAMAKKGRGEMDSLLLL